MFGIQFLWRLQPRYICSESINFCNAPIRFSSYLPVKCKMSSLSPQESGEFIVKNAKYVQIHADGIEKLSNVILEGIKTKKIDVTNFSQHNLHPKPTDSYAVEWIFLVDTLNFCFWTQTNYTKYKVRGYTGYFALCAAINRAIEEGIDITNANIYSKIDETTLRKIFRSDDGITEVPLIEKRVECLHEVGNRLLTKWNGKFENVVKAAENSTDKLLKYIVEEFPCFRDEADYCGKRVSIYKRAQILIGDLWACFRGEGIGYFKDLEKVTMFADYRVPQVLVHFGCLEYNPQLTEVLKSDVIMKNGDPKEIEIRGASIYIVEQVKKAVLKRLAEEYPDISTSNVNSILIDHFLWDYRREYANELEHIPFHKVLCVYY